MAARGVVDQIRQRLRDGADGDGRQVGRDRLGRTARVQGAAYGARPEPPHRRRASGLPVRGGVQERGEPDGRGAGDDGREVGAEAGGLGGGGQQVLTGSGQGFGVMGLCDGADTGEGAASDDAEQFGLADMRGERSGILGELLGERAVPAGQRPQFRCALRPLPGG